MNLVVLWCPMLRRPQKCMALNLLAGTLPNRYGGHYRIVLVVLNLRALLALYSQNSSRTSWCLFSVPSDSSIKTFVPTCPSCCILTWVHCEPILLADEGTWKSQKKYGGKHQNSLPDLNIVSKSELKVQRSGKDKIQELKTAKVVFNIINHMSI